MLNPKELFIAVAYSPYKTADGGVQDSYRDDLERDFVELEADNRFKVRNTLRDNNYVIDENVDIVLKEFAAIKACDGFISVAEEVDSSNKRTLLGYALGVSNTVVMLAHTPSLTLHPYDKKLVEEGLAYEIAKPFDVDQIDNLLTA